MAYHADRISLSTARGTPADRRSELFREGIAELAKRHLLGLAWALQPGRIGGVPNLLRMCFHELLAPDHALPDPARALDSPPGLAGIVHDLTLPTLLTAYRRGLYPFGHIAPLKWWSPPTRAVLEFKDFHIASETRRIVRQGRYTVTLDRDFEAVIAGCAKQRRGQWHLTWITPRIMRAYAQAFDAGHAHSYEVWNQAGELVAGGYGMATGGAFSGESQFSRERNTSKIGMTVLNWHLAKWGYAFNDGKINGPLWESMGFRDIPRQDYLKLLEKAVRAPGKSGRWAVEDDLATISRWKPEEAMPG